VLTLGVQVTNDDARTAYERLGFQPESLRLFAPIEHLLERSERAPRGPSFGSVHVQTDDENAVEQAVRKYVPRFGRSAGSVVATPRNGWTRSTTSSATASRARCGGSAASSRTRPAPWR
jgi:hypothetical protein